MVVQMVRLGWLKTAMMSFKEPKMDTFCHETYFVDACVIGVLYYCIIQ
jgi:hypothetical protein